MSFSFPSSGNVEQDEEESRRIERSFRRRALGLCPNDETPMVLDSPNTRHCPKCGYFDGSTEPFPPLSNNN